MTKEIVDPAASQRTTDKQSPSPVELTAGDWSPLDNSLWDLLDEDAEYDWGISSGVSGQRMEGEPQSVAEPSDVK